LLTFPDTEVGGDPPCWAQLFCDQGIAENQAQSAAGDDLTASSSCRVDH
jgi:hypothetical protein